MADIINCAWTSDGTSSSDKCAGTAGFVAFYLGRVDDVDLVATSSALSYNDATESLLLPFTMNAGKKLKKINVDKDTIHFFSKGDGKSRRYDDSIEVTVNGSNAAKRYNYRRMLGCCGMFAVGVKPSGAVEIMGLQPNGSGILESIDKPLTNDSIEYDSDIASNNGDTANSKYDFKFSGQSTHGILVGEKDDGTPSMTIGELDALTV